MLAEIGIIIGLYIITRMISFIMRKEDRSETNIVKICCIITITITIIVILDLLTRGLNISPPKQISSMLTPKDGSPQHPEKGQQLKGKKLPGFSEIYDKTYERWLQKGGENQQSP